MNDVNNVLWVEKYRPKTLSDCILPIDLNAVFKGMVKEGTIPNMLFYGKAGTGKTTVARALAVDIGAEYIIINCSEENGIDTLRTKIRQYASTVSLSGNLKVIILDEFDYANPQSIQPALRGAIEEFHKNCRFILTCNYKSRVIEPLHSRCTGIDFTVPNAEKAQIAKAMMGRIEYSKQRIYHMNSKSSQISSRSIFRIFVVSLTSFKSILLLEKLMSEFFHRVAVNPTKN